MQGIQVADKITLDDTVKKDRGPIVKVKAVLPERLGQKLTGWYGITIKQHKARVNGEVFDCYMADFSDVKRKSIVTKDGKEIKAGPGWMEFVDPADRKRWEAWKVEQAKAQKAEA
jgi:hypothetical protein